MSPADESKGDQEAVETTPENHGEIEAVAEEEEPKPIPKWLWAALILVLGGIVFLLVFNFLHRSPGP